MKLKIISSGLIAMLIILGSFGAVGTTSENETVDDCGCGAINEINNIASDKYFFGQLEREGPQPPGQIFPGMAPTALDWRNKDGHDWTTPIKNQGSCGSCYAFGAYAAMEACIKIETGNPNLAIDLSEQFMVSCGTESFPGGIKGCEGAYSPETFDFLEQYGAIPEDCFPYTSGGGSVPPCSNKCNDWQSKVITVEEANKVSNTVDSIKNAISQRGPVSAVLEVYTDFVNYNGGIYEHTSGNYEGLHRIALVGYNDDPGYWIGKNSWGTSWGEDGWFRIAYGECDIEDDVYFVNPNPTGIIEAHCKGKNYVQSESSGDIKYWGNNGIELSEGGNSATAVFHFTINGEKVKQVGINYREIGTFGNGPDVFIYNYNSNSYQCLKTNMGGTGSSLEWKWVSTQSGNYINSDGKVKVKIFAEADGWLSGDNVLLELVGIRYTEKPKIADLESEGSLNFGSVKGGNSVTKTIYVKNVGDSGSLLNWRVDDYPRNWGSWAFIPASGTGLTPEDGKVAVKIRVTAPTEYGSYSGSIKIVNKDNSNDYETIPVSLTSPMSRSKFNINFLQFLDNFPLLHKLLHI